MAGKKGHDVLKAGSPESHRRQEIWKHNSFMGYAAMMKSQCRSILNSSTATDDAKQIAVRIEQDAEMLGAALKKRKDQL